MYLQPEAVIAFQTSYNQGTSEVQRDLWRSSSQICLLKAGSTRAGCCRTSLYTNQVFTVSTDGESTTFPVNLFQCWIIFTYKHFFSCLNGLIYKYFVISATCKCLPNSPSLKKLVWMRKSAFHYRKNFSLVMNNSGPVYPKY